MIKLNKAALAAVVATCVAGSAWAQTDAVWNPAIHGGDDSGYSDAANWDINTVPINNGTTFNVTIPNGNDVILDAGVLPGDTVDAFNLGDSSTFTVNPGLSYNVLGAADVGGRIDVDNSSFSAASPTSMFSGRPFLFADNSGSIAIAASSWAASYSGSQTFMWADNGATIDLSTLGNLTANETTSFTDVVTVHALNGGSIDLSNLSSASSNDVLQFLIESGGDIALPNLTTTTGVEFDIHIPSYTLLSLNTANRTDFNIRSGNTISANAMTDQAGGSVNLETNVTFNANALQQMRNTTLTAQNGATFSAPVLTDVAGSTLNLDPGFTFSTASLNNIDGAKISVAGGKVFNSVTATSMTGTYSNNSETVLRAENAGSVLNLASLTSMTLNESTSFVDTLTVHARDNGQINLSNLSSAASNDTLRFLVESGGQIDLSKLTQTTNVQFDVRTGQTLDVNALVDFNGRSIDLAANAALNATALQSMRNATLNAAGGATLNAPALSDVAGSTLNLDPGFTFTTAPLAQIDNSRIFVTGGLNFANVSDSNFVGSYANNSETILQADGAGSVIDLSSVTQATLNETTSFVDTLSIVASAGGQVLMPNVDTLSTNNRLVFHAQGQSTIDLSSLQAVGAGQYEFRVDAEGTLLLGDFTVTNDTTFNINDVTSTVVVNGSLLLDNPAAFNVATGGGLSVAENFSFAITEETAFQSDDGILTMNGSGTFGDPQFLEVGGQDLGLPGVDFGDPEDINDPFLTIGENGNFNLGKLVVGQTGQTATVVELIDAIDNGNRLSPEALYLPGFGGDGLEIFGGSTLNIESINVYAFLDGQWTHLNSLFTDGIVQISLASIVNDPEADGFIVIPEPTSLILLGIGGLAMMRRSSPCGDRRTTHRRLDGRG